MTIQARQIREHLIRPVITELGLWSQARENLLLGTAAHESAGFTCIKQVGAGPALSMFQIEPETYQDLCINTLPGLRKRLPVAMTVLNGMVPKRYAGMPPADHLLRDAGFACAIAALLYWRAPPALPAADDLPGLAAYWKRFYNTEHGAGRVEHWLDAYRRHCND